MLLPICLVRGLGVMRVPRLHTQLIMYAPSSGCSPDLFNQYFNINCSDFVKMTYL